MAAVTSNQLNNLDTLRSYGSAGDELENVPLDYLRNLNRGNNTKIINGNGFNNILKNIINFYCLKFYLIDLKAIPDVTRVPRRSMHCSEEDTKILGGYHWDCSDWVRRSQNPLPNISEVPGSEVPDSSSFHSDSNDEVHHHIIGKFRFVILILIFTVLNYVFLQKIQPEIWKHLTKSYIYHTVVKMTM